MKNVKLGTLKVFFVLMTVFMYSCQQEEIDLVSDIEDPESIVGGCIMQAVFDTNTECPDDYLFTAIGTPISCGNLQYSWTVTGDAFFVGSTNANSANIRVDRSWATDGSFTVTCYRTCGVNIISCSRTFDVMRTSWCP